jgi:guanylate kinase
MKSGTPSVSLSTLSGASGAGKSSYIRAILALKSGWRLVPSVTTRAPRAKDLPGEYAHVTAEEFAGIEMSGDLLWEFQAYGHRYGTRRADVLDAASRDTLSLMPIAPETVPKLRKALDAPVLAVLHVYCCAPGEKELRVRNERRRARGDKVSDEEIERRIAECRRWDADAYASGIPYVFLSGDVTVAEGAERIINAIAHLGGRS